MPLETRWIKECPHQHPLSFELPMRGNAINIWRGQRAMPSCVCLRVFTYDGVLLYISDQQPVTPSLLCFLPPSFRAPMSPPRLARCADSNTALLDAFQRVGVASVIDIGGLRETGPSWQAICTFAGSRHADCSSAQLDRVS
mgnify:CR=1 FL=1